MWPPPLPVRAARRVVVTGCGLVSPLGVGVRRAWRRLLAGEHGLAALEWPSGGGAAALLRALPCRVAMSWHWSQQSRL